MLLTLKGPSVQIHLMLEVTGKIPHVRPLLASVLPWPGSWREGASVVLIQRILQPVW